MNKFARSSTEFLTEVPGMQHPDRALQVHKAKEHAV